MSGVSTRPTEMRYDVHGNTLVAMHAKRVQLRRGEDSGIMEYKSVENKESVSLMRSRRYNGKYTRVFARVLRPNTTRQKYI